MSPLCVHVFPHMKWEGMSTNSDDYRWPLKAQFRGCSWRYGEEQKDWTSHAWAIRRECSFLYLPDFSFQISNALQIFHSRIIYFQTHWYRAFLIVKVYFYYVVSEALSTTHEYWMVRSSSKDDFRTAAFESWRSRFEAKRALPMRLVSWSWWQRLMPRWHRLEVRFVKRRRKTMSQTSPRVSQRFLFPAVRALAKKQRQPSLSESAHFSEIMIWIVFESWMNYLSAWFRELSWN